MMSEWQRIEVGQRDNPRCLTYTPYIDPPDERIRICPADLIWTHSMATHWMPLPEPPK